MAESPTLDPDTERLIERFRADGVQTYDQLGVLRARRVLEGVTRLQGDRSEVAEVRDLLVPGDAGLLPARLYRADAGGDGPLVVYFHGGGWVLGSIDAADRPCRSLVAASGCSILSVGYRLAPETPYPGPLDDCWAAWCWVAGHADELGCDPGRLAVAGDSAGGNLAAAVSMAARDAAGPSPVLQALVYPVLSPPPAASQLVDGDGHLLTTDELRWFWQLYLGDAGTDPPISAAPLLAPDLGGLAPGVVVTAGFDPLRDEGLTYVARLSEAGVRATSLHYPEAAHGSMWMAGVLPVGQRMITDLGAVLRRQLRPAASA